MIATGGSMPVATTDTRTRPSRLWSKVAPRMMLASESTSSRMRVAASSTSYSVRSLPPVMEMSRPRAPRMVVSSSSGLEIAASAAASARFSPEASPVPIIALPISRMTVRTSAKSRLMRPSLTMRSVMQATPEYSTWSAMAKASAKVVFSLATRKRFWLGMMRSVSTYLESSWMPASAMSMRRAPSKWKGLVMTPTERMPISRVMRAMTGAAPVPVPPPMPAVMKAMCAPFR